MYGINNDTSSGDGSLIIPAGINEKVTFVKAAYENASNAGTSNYNVLAFHFEKNGATYTDKIFPVDEERTKSAFLGKMHNRDNLVKGYKKGEAISPEQALQIAYDTVNTRIKHILSKIVPESQMVITINAAGKSKEEAWKMYCDKVSTITAPYNKIALVNLKLILDTNDYISSPKYPPFVEKYSEGSVSSLRIRETERITASNVVPDTEPDDADTEF